MTGTRASSMRARALVPLGLALVCGPAQAHLNATGMGPIYDGLLHFLTSPEDLVPALALALLAGLRGATCAKRTMFTLPAAWLLGTVGASTATAANGGSFAAALWFVLLGALVLADAKLSLRAMTMLAALVGLAHGYLNGSGMGLSSNSIVAALGLAAAVFVCVVLAAAIVVPLRSRWARIVVRVLGSWIAASGILMIGWSLRGS